MYLSSAYRYYSKTVSHILKRELYSEYIPWSESRFLSTIYTIFYLSKQGTEAGTDSDTTERQVLKSYWWLVPQLYRTYASYLTLKKRCLAFIFPNILIHASDYFSTRQNITVRDYNICYYVVLEMRL